MMQVPVMAQRPRREFLRFLAVGVLNSLFGYGIFATLLLAGMHYSLALLLATVAGVLFNFKTTGILVFGSRDNRLLFRFVATYAVVYAVNVSLLKALLLAGLDPYLAGALLVLPVATLAFVLNRKLVFNNG
jgi:putative flippase GtrA